jgi:hypothetical protein
MFLVMSSKMGLSVKIEARALVTLGFLSTGSSSSACTGSVSLGYILPDSA